MINSKRLAWALNKTDRVHITSINDGSGFETSVCKYDRNNKMFVFGKDDNKIEIKRNKIKMISRLETVPDKYLFYIETDCKEYKLELFMKARYTPFCVTQYERKNVKDVATAIPKYLNEFKNKTVVVTRSSSSAVFSMWDIEDRDESHIVTDAYIFDDFNFDSEIIDGIVVLKLFDNSNSRIYTTGLNIVFVIGDRNKAIFGAKNGEYTLKILE